MRTALPWPPAIVAALITATPLLAAASEDTTPPPAAAAAAKAQATPAAAKSTAPAATKPAGTTGAAGGAAAAGAAKPAAAAGATAPAAAKPAGTAAPAAAKPAGAATPAAAKPAGATAPAAAKPATPVAAGAAGTAGATAPTGAKPAPPAAAGAAGTPAAGAKPPTPAAPAGAKPVVAPTGSASAPSPASPPADPAGAHLTLAQATAGLKGGTGAIVATIEIASEGKPAQALHCELYADKAPLTVANFVALGRGLRLWKDPKTGQWVKRPLYDGNLLHRVIPELLIQGGDPSCTGDPSCRGAPGVGDPGYTIVDEIRPELRFDRAGRLGMSNRGPGTGGSQFFITEREASWLNGSNTLFGQCDGAELVEKLARVETGSRDMPKVPLTIKRITFARKGN